MSTTQNARYRNLGNRRLTWRKPGGRYWDRTSDLFGVNKVKFALLAVCLAVSPAQSLGNRWSGGVRIGTPCKIAPRFLPAGFGTRSGYRSTFHPKKVSR